MAVPNQAIAPVRQLHALHRSKEGVSLGLDGLGQKSAGAVAQNGRQRSRRPYRADGGEQQCYRSSWRIGSFGSSGRLHPPRYAAFLNPPSPRFGHSSTRFSVAAEQERCKKSLLCQKNTLFPNVLQRSIVWIYRLEITNRVALAVTTNSSASSTLSLDEGVTQHSEWATSVEIGDWVNPKQLLPPLSILAIKRTLDVFVAASLLIIAAPLFFLVAMAILCQRDGGKLLYSQRRICRSGQFFQCYKFRSMCSDADERLSRLLVSDPTAQLEWSLTHKLSNDPRVTPVGRFLRATSLDELPQLWNVLKGDLSLVGPRPVTQVELEGPYARYCGQMDYLSVRPGITGLWQVSGRSLVGYEARVALDKQYVRTLSLTGDMRILLRTVGVVLGRKGAC